MGLPTGTVLAGPSAAYVWGIAHAAAFEDDVHVIIPPVSRTCRPNGIRVHATALDPRDRTVVDGLSVTTPARTAWDVATWLDLEAAVGVIDTMVGRGIVGRTALSEVFARMTERPGPGSRRARIAFDLVDGRAESPPESWLRVRLVVAGFPRPEPQFWITLPDGISRVRLDLAWPSLRVAVEYDGLWHGTGRQFHMDRNRLNQLVASGWFVLHVTSKLLHRDFGSVTRVLARTLRSRGWMGQLIHSVGA